MNCELIVAKRRVVVLDAVIGADVTFLALFGRPGLENGTKGTEKQEEKARVT